MRGCLYSKRSSRMFSTRSAPRRKALSIESSSPWSSWRASAGCSATENACYFPTVNRVSTEAPATAVVVRKGSHVPTLGQRRTAHCGDESEPPRHVLSRHAASMGRTLGNEEVFSTSALKQSPGELDEKEFQQVVGLSQPPQLFHRAVLITFSNSPRDLAS